MATNDSTRLPDVRARETASTDATRDDFNNPTLGPVYERFLDLLVLANGRDRFKAMRLRREKGVEVAVAFLEGCTLAKELCDAANGKPEQAGILHAAGEPYSEVSQCITEARALADILQMSTDNNEPDHESITTTAGMVYTRMGKALEHLDALWVAIGGNAS